MCVIEQIIYVKPNGDEELVEQKRLCSLKEGRNPCADVQRQVRKIYVQDPGSPSHSIASPSSISNPGTPIQYREVRPPPVVVDGRSTGDADTRRRSNRLSTEFVIQFRKSKGKGKEREKRYNRRSADSTLTSGSDSAYYAEPQSPREPRPASSPLNSLPRPTYTGPTSYTGSAAYGSSAYAQTQTPPPPPPPPRKPPVSAAFPDSPPPERRRRHTKVVVHHEEDTAPEVLDRANARERQRAEDRQRWEDTDRITRENVARQAEDACKERDRANYRENQRQADRLTREKEEKKRREDEARQDTLNREEASRRRRRESDAARANERATFRPMEQESPRATRTRRESFRTQRPSLRPEQRPDVQQLRANMQAERIQQEEAQRLEALELQHRERYDPRYGAGFQPPINPSLRRENRNVGVDYGNAYAGRPSTTTTYRQADQARIREVVPGPPDLHERGHQVLEEARNAGRVLQDQLGDLTFEDDVFNEHRPGNLHRRNTSGGGGASGGRRRKSFF